jgi:hypothetical protein
MTVSMRLTPQLTVVMVTTVAEVTAKRLMRIMFFEATFPMMSASEIQQSLPSRGVTISNQTLPLVPV